MNKNSNIRETIIYAIKLKKPYCKNIFAISKFSYPPSNPSPSIVESISMAVSRSAVDSNT